MYFNPAGGCRLDTEHDVVVVGANVAGASVARHLAERGLRVALVERQIGPDVGSSSCGDGIDVFYTGNVVLKPLLPTVGRNLVTFAGQDELLTSGFCWPLTLELLAETPYATYQSIGKGHVTAFTDDPNYRAMYPAVQRLFINAVLFGPGHY